MKSLIEAKYIPMILQNNTSPDVATQWYFYECLSQNESDTTITKPLGKHLAFQNVRKTKTELAP